MIRDFTTAEGQPNDDPSVSARIDPMNDTDLPKIGVPATRALASIGVTRLDQVVEYSERQLLALNGFGPRALRILGEAFAAHGLRMRS